MLGIPKLMKGVYLTGHGGLDQLVYSETMPVPEPCDYEVLIQVEAAGINNTDVNTRLGWYSKNVKTGTNSENSEQKNDCNDGSWSGRPVDFPRIQGADCCGRIVAVGREVSRERIGERVLVRNMLRSYLDYKPWQCWTFGSECDGAFAEYTKAPSRETYRVNSSWSSIELASIPCAYSTAEGMLDRARVKSGDAVLITGASGGVGSAAVQLTRRRGARVIGIANPSKQRNVLGVGADEVLDNVKSLEKETVDVVLDLVAGPIFEDCLQVLKRGGRYAVSGAIAGPIVELDVRTLYLKDLSFFGCSFQEDDVFENLISYIEKNELRPNIGEVYPLKDIALAQAAFISKKIPGKIVLNVST